MGRMKFSVHAYMNENVILLCSWRRYTGSLLKYCKVSFIQPMFHLNEKPTPPRCTGRDTPGKAVDSSAMVSTPGWLPCATVLNSRRNSSASRFSRPPYLLGSHSPALRL